MATPIGGLIEHLNEFASRADVLWECYQQQGPGRVDAELFQHVDSASTRVCDALGKTEVREQVGNLPNLDAEQLLGQLQQSLQQVHDLARRCACRPEGLCFVTGEAGLIPRRDQHAAFEYALRRLRDHALVLSEHEADGV